MCFPGSTFFQGNARFPVKARFREGSRRRGLELRRWRSSIPERNHVFLVIAVHKALGLLRNPMESHEEASCKASAPKWAYTLARSPRMRPLGGNHRRRCHRPRACHGRRACLVHELNSPLHFLSCVHCVPLLLSHGCI